VGGATPFQKSAQLDFPKFVIAIARVGLSGNKVESTDCAVSKLGTKDVTLFVS
jgi:hypothetical protein